MFVVDKVDAAAKKNMAFGKGKYMTGTRKKQPVCEKNGCLVICNHFLCADLVHHI